MDQLLTLLSSKPNEQLHATTTLLIGNRDWLDGKSLVIPFRNVSLMMTYMFENIKKVHHLASPIIEPRTFPQKVVKTTLRAFARLRLYLPASRFNLPNVTRVVYVVHLFSGTLLTYLRWNSGIDHPKWIISRIVKLLQRLPRLCELTLIMNKCSKTFDHIVDCVAKLHNLRKLTFRFIYAHYVGTSFSRPKINSVGKIIAANPDLSHLEVLCDNTRDLAQTLRHVPADRPLKLEHFRLSHPSRNPAAPAPHISSLTSVDLVDSGILQELLKQNIFPPTMTLWMMDQYTIKYLDRHPGIVSLTSYGGTNDSSCSTLLGILSRHSKTLTHLGFYHWTLYKGIRQTQNELALLQCKNLKQLALDYRHEAGGFGVVEPELRMMSLTRSVLFHVLNTTSTEHGTSTGSSIANNCSPSELSHTCCQR